MHAVQHVTHDFKFNKGLCGLYSATLMLKVEFKHICTFAWAYNDKPLTPKT